MKICFAQFFCVFLPPLLNIFCFFYHFCPLLSQSLHEVFPSISNFLKEISSLSHFVVFLYFFALIIEEGFLISPCYSLKLHSNGYIFPFLLCFWILFFSQLFVSPPQTAISPFYISFSWGWSWSLSPTQRHEPPSIVHLALCLSDLVPWIYLSLPVYNN